MKTSALFCTYKGVSVYSYIDISNYPHILIGSYDILGDRCIDDAINIFSVSFIKQIQCLFHAAVCLFSSRLQKVSKCDKNSSASHSALTLWATFFLSYFDVICDLLLNRNTTTWNLCVKYTFVIYWTIIVRKERYGVVSYVRLIYIIQKDL